MSGGNVLREEVAGQLQKKLELQVYQGYGAAECASLIAVNTPYAGEGRNIQLGAQENSLGRVVPGMIAKIVNEKTGDECGEDEEGVLWVYGQNVAESYVNPDHNPENLKDGWFCSHDRVRIDKDGFLFLAKDTTVSS